MGFYFYLRYLREQKTASKQKQFASTESILSEFKTQSNRKTKFGNDFSKPQNIFFFFKRKIQNIMVSVVYCFL